MKLSRLAFFDGTSPVADTNLRTLPESMLLIRYGKTAFTKGGIRGEFDFREEDADGVIRLTSARPLTEGTFVQARLTGADTYDLTGEVI